MRFLKRKKAVALLVTLVVVAASAFGAYAYFEGSGVGSGPATVGTPGTDIAITSTTSPDLFPLSSVPAANTALTFQNNGAGNEEVTFASLDTSVGGGTGLTITGAGPLGCSAGWFQVSNPSLYIGQDIPAGGSYTTPTNVDTIWLLDSSGINQSGCEGATVTAHWLSN